MKKKNGSVHNVCFLENLNLKLECTGAGNLKINIPVKSMMLCHHIENADRMEIARSHSIAQLSDHISWLPCAWRIGDHGDILVCENDSDTGKENQKERKRKLKKFGKKSNYTIAHIPLSVRKTSREAENRGCRGEQDALRRRRRRIEKKKKKDDKKY